METQSSTYYSVVLLFTLLLLSPLSYSQVCGGNLGENIFPDGDFGSGNTNVVTVDPQIAPGYIYQPHPPPNDGSYTITNYTGLWNLFPGWIKIRDNSTDIYGYMMVVNASHQPGSFYEKQIDGLCENTLYEFSADIINLLEEGSNGIKPNVSFLLNDQVLYTTGNVPENEEWNTYGFTFITEADQNSVKLSLKNNAAGGMGNDLALDNISFRPCGPEAQIIPEEITNMCEDGNPVLISSNLIGNQFDNPSFQWQQSFDQGITWENILGENTSTFTHNNFSSGYYYYRYLVANGSVNLSNYRCRIVSDMKVVYVIAKNKFISDTICNGLSYKVGDSEYFSSGSYIDSLKNSVGCDSIVNLNLTVVDDLGIKSVNTIENPSCSYQSDGSFRIDEISNAIAPISFFFDEVEYAIDQTIYNLGAGEYNYSIFDRYGCSTNETINIISPIPFAIDLGPDLEIDLGDDIFLSPDSNYEVINYKWEPNELIDCNDNCDQLSWVPPYSMSILNIATSINNCLTIDTVFVKVNKVRKVYLPNAFSPNGDGLNDYFTVFGSIPNVQKVQKMSIYNRWGQLIYELFDFIPNEPSIGWDGRYQGEMSPIGVYTYTINIKFLDAEIVNYNGNFTLLK